MLTAERLRELLDYNPDTGVFIWRHRKPRRTKGADSMNAGTRRGVYTMIGIDQTLYYGHRLAWLYVHGEWPSLHIDHINGDGRDNRIANLRCATRSENLCNKPVRRDSTTGLKCVFPKRNKFYSQIVKNGRTWNLGSFDTPEQAHAAYCEAAHELHGEFANIGGRP